MLKCLVVALATALSIVSAEAADKPTLTVYTYESFVGEYGPGQALKKAFEAKCGCELAFVSAEDGGALYAKLKLEGSATKADVLLGIDDNLMGEAEASGLIAPHGLEAQKLNLPEPWSDKDFVPYDWGYFAFVYDSDKLKSPPASLKELVESKTGPTIVIEDPRTSTPGLGLLAWVRQVYGDKAPEAWKALKPRIVTVTKGWSEAYGLFLKGEAAMVLSYSTSPAYHIGAEGKTNYKAAMFDEGHATQVEVAGIVASSPRKDLARDFLAFLLTDEAQALLPETNWMYPARTPKGGLPASFSTIPVPAKALMSIRPSSPRSGAPGSTNGWRRWRDETDGEGGATTRAPAMIPGSLVLAGLAVLVALSLAALGFVAPPAETLSANLPYLASIAGFTALQASLSMLISLGFGALLALALARRRFRGRGILLALLGVATALPAIVTVFAVTAIYGRAGLVNDGLSALGLPRFSIYGLSGILLAHVFFNASFAARVYLAALEAVPGEHWRLAASVGMRPAALLRLIDGPVLRRETPALALLVFIACSVSFAVPLALGGGPGAATFEVAIYEALRFDVDFGRAALLAFLQIGIMVLIVAAASPLLTRPAESAAIGHIVDRPDRDGHALLILDAVVLCVGLALVVPPLLSVAWGGRELLRSFDPAIGRALSTSLAVALPSAGLALAAALALTRARIAFAEVGRTAAARLMAVAPLIAIATPPLAFAAGLFILARSVGDPARIAWPTLILVNAMMALPFVHRLVDPPLTLAAERYGRLAASLGMGWAAHLRLIDWPLLGPSAGAAFAYAMALSLGDLGVVTLFGSDALVTLPALLYEKLGAYRVDEAAGVAALLCALVLALFLVADRLGRAHAGPR